MQVGGPRQWGSVVCMITMFILCKHTSLVYVYCICMYIYIYLYIYLYIFTNRVPVTDRFVDVPHLK